MGRATVFFRLVAAISLALLGTVGANADDPWTSRIAGRYTGQIRGAAQPMAVTTMFRSAPDQSVAGEYSFIEPSGARVDGTLESCGGARSRTIVCRWRDRHGEGTLDLIFAEDLQSFAGRWSSTIKPNNWYPWSGTRTR